MCIRDSMRTALYQMFCTVRYQSDQMVRADCGTLAAGNAFFLVDYCHAVDYMDGVKGAGLYAGAVAHTAVNLSLIHI